MRGNAILARGVRRIIALRHGLTAGADTANDAVFENEFIRR
jgi:hypothetical protein